MGKTNKQEICASYCKVTLNQPCSAEINTAQSYIVEFNPGSTLKVSYRNLSPTNTTQVTTIIGSQEQQPVNLQPGETQILKYKIAAFTYINFTNQAVLNNTFVQISVKQIPVVSNLLHYGDPIKLCISKNNGYIVSASYESIANVGPKEYFPRYTSSDAPIHLLLSGGSGVIKDGDTVKIETTETSVGEYKVLGAWRTPTLYYYKGGYDKNQEWTIRKKNNSDSAIYYGNEVYFLNHSYKDQWLCIEDSGTWLTTKKDANVYWLIDQP